METLQRRMTALLRKDLSSRPRLVHDERTKTHPADLPMLHPTLQTWVGMVIDNGAPRMRGTYKPRLDEATWAGIEQRVRELQGRCDGMQLDTDSKVNSDRVRQNLEACTLPLSKHDVLAYIRHDARLDMEQVVAMTIGYLSSIIESSIVLLKASGGFDETVGSIIDELVNDKGTVHMLPNTCMWREAQDYDLPEDPREASKIRKQKKILKILGHLESKYAPNTPSFTVAMQAVRRKRAALENTQRLSLPEELLPENEDARAVWSFDNSYRREQNQPTLPIDKPHVVSKRRFNRVYRLLSRIHGRMNPTSIYVRDVEALVKEHGAVSPERIKALEDSDDAAAIAFGFVAVMRRRQLKVVSDHGWSRFLVKGEGQGLMQNSPNVLTSFEDVLVEHAYDLRALTAVKCPEGVRDHFSIEADIVLRARKVCELMERYVDVFGAGKRENLTFAPGMRGGSGRGPVDLYNALCDELKDCRERAKAASVDLQIGPVHKFLAKDIMAYNKAWKDDAFADGKVPGWVDYLARVRAGEVELEVR